MVRSSTSFCSLIEVWKGDLEQIDDILVIGVAVE
jgi:hypothetical protein